MNSKIPNWMLREPAGCVSKRSEEEEEMGTRKRARRTSDSEEGVEEFLRLLTRIEEMKKHLHGKRSRNCSAGIAEGVNIMPGIQQHAQGSDFVTLAPCKSSSSTWKPSFQWEDFNINPLPAQTDLSCAATIEKNADNNMGAAAVLVGSMEEDCKGRGDSVQIGNARLKTRSFLDIIADTPAGCSHDRVGELNNKDEDADAEAHAPLELELRLFPR